MRAIVLLSVLVVSVSSMAPAPWADGVPLPEGYQSNADTLITHAYDEASFYIGTSRTAKRGAYTSGYLTRVPEGFHEPSDAAWKKWEPVLKAQGWTLKGHDGDSYTLQRVDGGAEVWLDVGLAEFQDPKLTMVRTGAAPRTHVLAAPPATPQPVADTAEWPFLTAMAGSTLENVATVDEPMDVTSGSEKEPHLVGRRYQVRQYTPPKSLSKLETELVYTAALTKAGWTVLPRVTGVAEGEGVVRAHYATGTRDLWVVIGRAADDSNTGFGISLADVGADDWTAALAKDCRLPLYGVTFDFDKATLRAESAPLLQKAANALTANASVAVEVQGHTDDVGDDAYNVRLSGQRAETVRSWLAQHGIAATRLTAKGYGKTQPVVENSSDANRARNRRVELRCK
ncbi:MAG: OmpA family protein [Vicinamibacterales bacterium]